MHIVTKTLFLILGVLLVLSGAVKDLYKMGRDRGGGVVYGILTVIVMVTTGFFELYLILEVALQVNTSFINLPANKWIGFAILLLLGLIGFLPMMFWLKYLDRIKDTDN